MSDEQRKNLLVRNKADHLPYYAYEDGWLDGRGVTSDGRPWNTTTDYDFSCELTPGTYTLTVECDGPDARLNEVVRIQSQSDVFYSANFTAGAGISQPLTFEVTDETAGTWRFVGKRRGARWRVALFAGTEPAAWSPYVGETLVGGGALMSANLLVGVKPKLASGATESDGIISIAANTGSERNVVEYAIPGQSALSANQTCHIGISLRAASGGNEWTSAVVEYADSAGNANGVSNVTSATGDGAWHRHELSVVVPSGMHVVGIHFNQDASGTAIDFANPTLSYGSPVTLASSAHTPYATQDHLRSEYATKAALRVTSDAVTAEVEERGKLAGRVGTLESTSGTHASKLEQLATSIKSLVKGESTYTDPDGASATSGIYSLVTQTRDSVTALFGQYTKTADLASTQAVKDAKKAGTDAASAASAAQSTADTAKANAATAQSTADRAQSTADAALDNAGTANGRVRAVEARVSASIDGLDVRVRGVSEAVSAQGATVRDVERNMSFGLDGLVIGAADSASKVRITEKRETFEVDGKTVLALDGDTSTVEASALKIGGYVWTATNGGKNLTLVYRG